MRCMQELKSIILRLRLQCFFFNIHSMTLQLLLKLNILMKRTFTKNVMVRVNRQDFQLFHFENFCKLSSRPMNKQPAATHSHCKKKQQESITFSSAWPVIVTQCKSCKLSGRKRKLTGGGKHV